MFYRLFPLIIALLLNNSCQHPKTISTMDSKNCFANENHVLVKEYIIERIKFSGMGKFYVEYPLPKNRGQEENPGNKKLPENIDNVYDVTFDESLNQIIFKNKPCMFVFKNEKGFVNVSPLVTANDDRLANELFCHLLSLAIKK